ncbi:MAG: YdcF family protein [Desulfobacterales bacterium]
MALESAHPAADAIIVLGAPVRPDGTPGEALRSRTDHGIRLFWRRVAPRLVLSGGARRHPPPEALVMKSLVIAGGVPPDAVLVEDRSRTTFENALNCAHIFREHGWRSAIIVTDDFHCFRAGLMFRAAGLAVRTSPCPPSGTAVQRLGWILRELPALIWYGGLAIRVRRMA